MRSPKRLKLNLALQGGGAHGAFTWGALDRLLEEPRVDIQWISGTSAGAINAVAVASGLATTGASGARMTLKRVWDAVERTGVPDLVKLNPFLSGLSMASSVANFAGMLSPYDLNPLRIDPLRSILELYIDFAALSQSAPVELLIAATEVETGRARLFRRQGLRIEHVLASACLPTLHHATEIDGRLYWDGGFSANPDLITLASESPCRDTLLIELNPRSDKNRPRTAADIAARIAAITFNQPLLRDIELILAAQKTDLGLIGANRDGLIGKLNRHRFHLIEAGQYTTTLSQESKGQPDAKLLAYLFEAGRTEADRWLTQYAASVGKTSTVDFDTFVDGPSSLASGEVGPKITAPGSVAPFHRPRGGQNRG